MYENPLAGLNPTQIYRLFKTQENGFPNWPSEELQAGYTASVGADCVRRGQTLIDSLRKERALDGDWKGLDYGCGWGRLASLMLAYGPPEQLDVCDAWDKTLRLFEDGGFQNHRIKVPEVLEDGSLPTDTYDFVTAYSVFTHLRPDVFENNIRHLQKSLRSGGALYITVRHEDFFVHRYPEKADEGRTETRRDQSWFCVTKGDINETTVFGDTVITSGFLDRFGTWRYLGAPFPLQHLYAIDRA